jgi:hypothetical protein
MCATKHHPDLTSHTASAHCPAFCTLAGQLPLPPHASHTPAGLLQLGAGGCGISTAGRLTTASGVTGISAGCSIGAASASATGVSAGASSVAVAGPGVAGSRSAPWAAAGVSWAVGSTGISAGLSESAEVSLGELLGGVGRPLMAALGFWQLQQA